MKNLYFLRSLCKKNLEKKILKQFNRVTIFKWIIRQIIREEHNVLQFSKSSGSIKIIWGTYALLFASQCLPTRQVLKVISFRRTSRMCFYYLNTAPVDERNKFWKEYRNGYKNIFPCVRCCYSHLCQRKYTSLRLWSSA